MVKLLPEDQEVAVFNKRLEVIVDDTKGESGKMKMVFRDGTEAEADAIIGCDGIKSRTRELIVGEGSPEAKCRYSYKYAYRGLISMDEAINQLGEEKASNASLWVWLSPNFEIPDRCTDISTSYRRWDQTATS